MSRVIWSTVVASWVYLVTQHQVLVLRSGSPTPVDLIAGIVTILVILGVAACALMLPGLATDGFGMMALVVIVSRK